MSNVEMIRLPNAPFEAGIIARLAATVLKSQPAPLSVLSPDTQRVSFNELERDAKKWIPVFHKNPVPDYLDRSRFGSIRYKNVVL